MLAKITGLYHFLADRVPANLPLVEPKPRKARSFLKQDKVTVKKYIAVTNLQDTVASAFLLPGNSQNIIKTGDHILIKPNFNSPDPFPASTDRSFLEAVIKFCLELGGKVTVGESSGGVWRPTKKVFEKLGIDRLARKMGIKLVSFEDLSLGWVRIKIQGDYLNTVTIPRLAYEADKIIYLPCMKTHKLGIFSGALKLTVGLVHPGERRALHFRNLLPKIAEINLACQPDMIIMDGRKAFITGGPDKGQIAEPGIILVSGDPVVIDVEAMKTILQYRAANRIPSDPWTLPQIKQALKIGLGPVTKSYSIIE